MERVTITVATTREVRDHIQRLAEDAERSMSQQVLYMVKCCLKCPSQQDLAKQVEDLTRRVDRLEDRLQD